MTDDLRVTAGARRVRQYCKKLGISVTRFAETNGIDRIQLLRAMNGERWQRVTVDFAHKLHTVSRGFIHWSLWRSATARPIKRAA